MPPPEKFEHYLLLKNDDGSLVELGHGAMGVTYKAFDTNLRCNVALKVISAAHLHDPIAAERFLREARGAAQLRHRNVASVFHLGKCGDSYFYSMEFIEGETLEAQVKREGPLSPLLALEITSQVAAALIAASKRGLIHRDIKPANLMLIHEDDGDLIVKVIDFGLVKSAFVGSTAGALTSGGFVGTPYFASPEQLDQGSEDIRSDIYSLGITLWFMLTGKPTFMGSVASVIAQHLDKVPAFESLAVLPTCVVEVLRRMLEKDVGTRIQTPLELRIELKRCIEVLGGEPSRVTRPATSIYDEALENVALSSSQGLEPPPRPGSILGSRYQLIEDLNPSNPGHTFHGEDTGQKRRVRIQIVRCPETAFAVIREQVARLQGAAHPNFTAVLAAERTSVFGYLVWEWLEGFALVDLLRARRELTVRETLALLRQIAPATDVARDLGVRPVLQLRKVRVHFPDGFNEPDAQVILRCPIAEWPGYVVKLDPLGALSEVDELRATPDRTVVRAPETSRPAVAAEFAAIAYDLLGGKPGASAPLANLSEEGNAVLRRAMGGREQFSSAQAFVDQFGQAAKEVSARPTQPLTPQDPKSAAASVPIPRAPEPVEKAGTPPLAPAPPPTTFRPPNEAETARVKVSRKHWRTVAGVAGAAAFVAVGVFVFSGDNPAPKTTSKGSGPAPTQNPITAAPRQPPQPGKPWKSGLGTMYLPLGNVWVAATETRVRDFDAFVQAKHYDATGGMESLQRDGLKDHGHTWQDPGFKQSPEHPVVGVSREDAGFFCKWLTDKEHAAGALTSEQSYRLPTDREWSEAVGLPFEAGATPEERSGKIKGVYPWGRTFPPPDNSGNYAGLEAREGAPANWPVISLYRDPFPRTCPVPAFKANERGFYDLGGNVWEWCQDAYGKTNPRWGVLRGGSWATSHPEEMLSSYRRGFDPGFREDDVGFRCVIATDSGKR